MGTIAVVHDYPLRDGAPDLRCLRILQLPLRTHRRRHQTLPAALHEIADSLTPAPAAGTGPTPEPAGPPLDPFDFDILRQQVHQPHPGLRLLAWAVCYDDLLADADTLTRHAASRPSTPTDASTNSAVLPVRPTRWCWSTSKPIRPICPPPTRPWSSSLRRLFPPRLDLYQEASVDLWWSPSDVPDQEKPPSDEVSDGGRRMSTPADGGHRHGTAHPQHEEPPLADRGPTPDDVTEPMLWVLAVAVASAHRPDIDGRCTNLQCHGQQTPCQPTRTAHHAARLGRRIPDPEPPAPESPPPVDHRPVIGRAVVTPTGPSGFVSTFRPAPTPPAPMPPVSGEPDTAHVFASFRRPPAATANRDPEERP
ncbi:hypothetical protein [Actinoplanes sp. NPDC026623]|uniref:hypothetical protein n=1 Tax=Actinoplanes sp. NPDC026623 TaxID=3155610 RepID=UPI0033E8D223